MAGRISLMDEDEDYVKWETMAQCQQGALRRNGTHTGAVCRQPKQCRVEGRCHFVYTVMARYERANICSKLGANDV